MTREHTANDLSHIADDQVSEAALQTFCNTVHIGPLKIAYCLDLTVPEVTVKVYLLDQLIGGATLNKDHPSVTIGGGVLGQKAEVKLTAEFDKKRVTYEITVKTTFGSKSYSGTLFSW